LKLYEGGDMSSEGEVPPQVQQDLRLLEEKTRQYDIISRQRQELERELMETNNALAEIEKLPENAEVYKAVGYLLIKVNKETVKRELEDRRDILELRVKRVRKQEERLIEDIEKLRERIRTLFRGTRG